MTQKPKKQSYDPTGYLFTVVLTLLASFFYYGAAFRPVFFLYLIVALTVILIFLIVIHNRLAKLHAQVDLQRQNYLEYANLIEADIRHEKTAIAAFRNKIVDFGQLKGLTEKLSMCLTPEDTSKTLSSQVDLLFGDNHSTIILYLFHSKTGELGLSSSQKGQMRVNIKSKKGDVFDQWLVKTMQPLLIEDTKNDFRFDIERIHPQDSREIGSLIGVPLMVGNKALGILRVDSPREGHYTTEDLRFLTTIGDLGAVAIENAQLYERVEQLAITDGLTGLYLRRYLMERMTAEINRQIRRNTSLSFLMIDLDYFKQYNDKFGHVAGDIVLRSIGRVLTEYFSSPGMLVCRYGGEEFSVLLPDCRSDKAAKMAEEVRKMIEGETILLRRERSKITVSIGVASFPKDARSVQELVHKADIALYQAKEKGRNQVCRSG